MPRFGKRAIFANFYIYITVKGAKLILSILNAKLCKKLLFIVDASKKTVNVSIL